MKISTLPDVNRVITKSEAIEVMVGLGEFAKRAQIAFNDLCDRVEYQKKIIQRSRDPLPFDIKEGIQQTVDSWCKSVEELINED